MEWRKSGMAVCFFGMLYLLPTGCKEEDPPAPLPSADFSFQILDPGKPPARVVFTSNSKFATSHFWRFTPQASSTEISPTHDFRASGTFQVQLTVSNDEGEDTISKSIVLPPLEYYAQHSFLLPNPLNLPVEVRFVDESFGTPINYFWDFGNGTVSNERNPTAIYTAFGNYTVRQLVTFRGGGVDSLRLTLRLRQ